ncbi:MAG: methyltransferase, partial [Flavobacteriaceae bacterium]
DAKYYKHQWAALDVPRHLWHFTSIGLIKMVEENNFMFQSQHPLWFDSFYISYMSEAQKGASFAFVRGVVIGFLSNIKALINGEYSSKIYVFKKKV